jgi:hypothetical protein
MRVHPRQLLRRNGRICVDGRGRFSRRTVIDGDVPILLQLPEATAIKSGVIVEKDFAFVLVT